MEFRQVKELCKYAGPGVICPQNFKNCNSNNCPLAINTIIDEQECDRYCPIVDKYRDDVRQFKIDYINANEDRKRLEKAYKDMLEQAVNRSLEYDAVKAELAQNLNNAFHVINDSLFDLKDKLNTTLKRLDHERE